MKKLLTAHFFSKPFLATDLDEFEVLSEQIVSKNQYQIELIKDNDVVFDAGANIGVFSVYVAMKHPSATIYAFEPSPRTFMALKENTKDYPNIKVFNCGLGEADKDATIIVKGTSGGNYIDRNGMYEKPGLLRKGHRAFKHLVYGKPCHIRTIDSFGMRVDFLKMDTEGYEANIITGAAKTIREYKPIVAMSAYHKPNDKTDLPALLKNITPYNCGLFNNGLSHAYEEVLVCKPR